MTKLLFSGRTLSLGILAVFFWATWGVATERTLYSICVCDGRLRTIDPLTGSTRLLITVTLSGATVVGANGLARDPTTGKLWALLQLQGQTGRQLVTINPANGVATSVGNTGDRFAGIAFRSNGTLYGVTGDGATVPTSLFTLNKSNGTPSLVMALSGGGTDAEGGEALGFNPGDGLLYRASGFTSQLFQSINPGTLGTANIAQSGAAHNEVAALTHSHGNTLLMVDIDGKLFSITTAGVVSLRGATTHDPKGITFLPKPPYDFDADTKTDLGVYQTSTGNWFFIRSTQGFLQQLNFGGANFLPVPGDYDGDGEVDNAVYDTTNGNWFLAQSQQGFRVAPSFGGLGFIPVPGDYDGDGQTDPAVYQESTGHWFFVGSTTGFSQQLGFGGAGFVPVPGDYDGDGQTDPAVYQLSTGHWFFVGSTSGFGQQLSFGGTGFIPVPGDYDGDGRMDPAVYQESTGHWFFVRSTLGFGQQLSFGGSGFIPVAGDYDGDGKTDPAVYQQTNGNWFIAQTTAGFKIQPSFGGAGFVPVLPQVTIWTAVFGIGAWDY